MKKVPLFLIASVLLFTACKKNSVEKNDKPAKLSFISADRIPNEIIPLLYNELERRGLTVQAENFRKDYYQTLSQRKDSKTDLLKRPYGNGDDTEVIMGANLNDRSVPNVGVVLDGNWVETNATYPTMAHVQDYGNIFTPFNAMNGTAPEGMDNANDPSNSQVIGTNDPKRMQKFRICTVKYGVPDDLGTTYYTAPFGFTYQSCVQNNLPTCWQGTFSSPDGESGTNSALRIQSIKIWGPGTTLTFNDAAPSTQAQLLIFYRVHQQDHPGGWTNWGVEGHPAGNEIAQKRIQALQVRAYLIKI
jgi:hypothetical protein